MPREFVPRLVPTAEVGASAASLTPYLLDFDQETWVKTDLAFDGVGDLAAARPRLVTGTAGSGKSLALIYRARLLAGLGVGRKVLLTTHNKPLISELRWRYERLGKAIRHSPGSRVEFAHFHRWANRFDHASRDVIPEHERVRRIAALAGEMFPSSRVPHGFFADEVAFLADQVDDSAPAYLALDRAGRGIPLDAGQRRRFHALYLRYRQSLAACRQTDWFFKVRIIWDRILGGQVNLPRYDLIVVDEAQFFAPLWFAVLKRCLDPERGEFLIAADPTQGFLRRRQSWRSVGLDVRGRSTRLGRSYRSSAAIQEFARRFYLGRLPDAAGDPDADDIALPDPGQHQSDPRSEPQLVLVRGPQDGIARIVAEVASAVEEGLPPDAILVLHADRRQLEATGAAIAEKLGEDRICRLSHDTSPRGAVGLATLNDATGIERPVVFLAGIDSVFEPEENPQLDPRERVQRHRDNTRKVYMALTRAGEKLVVYHLRKETAAALRGECPSEPKPGSDPTA